MVKYEDDVLNTVFAALADPTRRKVLQTLGQGSLSVGELAEPHGMSLPGFMKHLRVLEDAGLVTRAKDGRVVNLAIS
ncbi:MAG: ArsR/SmtB family transcription factor, partial [Lysobacterales bacterium]